jgi:acetolactate synthase-1/2/3 large subunit
MSENPAPPRGDESFAATADEAVAPATPDEAVAPASAEDVPARGDGPVVIPEEPDPDGRQGASSSEDGVPSMAVGESPSFATDTDRAVVAEVPPIDGVETTAVVAAPADPVIAPADASEEDPASAASEAQAVAAEDEAPAVAEAPDGTPETAPDGTPETAPDETPALPPERRVVTVGQHIAEMLHAAGARWAFTVPGESFLGLLDALGPAGIRVVATRHEGGAAFMAEAVSQLTGRPTIVLGTRAVGASNLAIGVHTARADSTPLIALVGQVERSLLGREAFQEADVAATIGGLAKWSGEPRTAEEVPGLIEEAVRRATSDRPGPVLLSLPEDLLDEPLAVTDEMRPRGVTPPRPDPGVIRSILHLLASAERPVILAGGGVLRARCSNDLLRLARLLRVPVIASWRRPDVVANDDPLFLGMTGYGAPDVVRQRLEDADAILVLGTRLSEVATFEYRIPHPGQRWAHVDLEPRAGAAGLPRPDLALAADARIFVRAALERLRTGVLDAATADARSERNAADRAAWEAAAAVDTEPWEGPGVHPGRIVATLRRVLADEAIVTTDAGNMSGWLARGFRFRRPGTFIGPTSGAMGYGLPAAIGAALVHRDRPVVAWTGDGGFAMTMNELETAVREKLRLVVLVLDNQRFGTIRMHQDDRPGAAVGTDLGPIDFAQIARGFGANGVRSASEDGFEAALRTALVADRPTVIQLQLDRRWISVDRREA